MAIVIRKLVAGDEAVLEQVAPGVFDEPVRPELTRRFLATPNYRIFVALDGDLVVGMCTGFTHFHPDKDEEFFVNELGVDDAYRGQNVKAFIVLKDGMAATAEEIDTFLDGRLSKIERPRFYEFRADLPKSIIGKILKKILADEEKARAQATKEIQ